MDERVSLPPETPAPPASKAGCCARFKNVLINNYRGLLGVIVPLLITPILISKTPQKLVLVVWIWMLWSFLLTPVATPVTGFMPVFLLPGMGILSSAEVCICYFNDMIALMVVGGWVAMALNHSEYDKRVILWFLSSRSGRISAGRLLIWSSVAAFLLSIFSRNVIVTMKIIDFIAPALTELHTATSGAELKEPNYNKARYITCCAIFTSSAIGSIAILNASFPTLCAAGIWSLSSQGAKLNVFNFLDYSLFAFPTSLAMFVANLIYHWSVLKLACSKDRMSDASKHYLLSSIQGHRKELPNNISVHEVYSLLAVVTSLVAYFTRRNRHFGWESIESYTGDATVAAMCCVIFSIIPKDCKFLRIFWTTKKSELPIKTVPGVLLFRFVDKSTNYGYLFLIGSGIALNTAVARTEMDVNAVMGFVNNLNWVVVTLIVCIITVILSSVIPGTAAVVILLPLIINSKMKNIHLLAVAIGVGGSLGFLMPFTATPAYYCCKNGKVPIKQMVKYGVLSSLICTIILWISLSFLAVAVWEEIKTGNATTVD